MATSILTLLVEGWGGDEHLQSYYSSLRGRGDGHLHSSISSLEDGEMATPVPSLSY